MNPLSTAGRSASRPGEPTWEVALLYPKQGEWSEEDYLSLQTNRLLELVDGYLEILPMPTYLHQRIVDFLHSRLKDYVRRHARGTVLFAPLPIRLRAGTYREPDIVYLRPEHIPKNPHSQPEGADLVVEVLSEGEENRRRDLETKRREYAEAGIGEYWIVDPQENRVSVLTLDNSKTTYRVHGEFSPEETATSLLLPGFAVSVAEVMNPDG